MAMVFSALGDDTRLSLLRKLAEFGPQSLGKLTEGESVTRQAVAKHLSVLANSGLAAFTRRGREQIWEVRTARLRETERHLEEISRQWDGAIDRLRKFVED